MKKTIFLTLIILPALIFAQKVVLIEQFTNASCGSCAEYTPQVVQYADSHNDNIISIVYHGPYPGLDSMYTESAEDVNSRMDFYNIFSVPTSFVDGTFFQGSSFDLLQNIDDTLSHRMLATASYNISFQDIVINETNVRGNIRVENSDSDVINTIFLHIALVEKLVLKSSYISSPGSNSETKYNYVVRKLLNSANGNRINFIDNEGSISIDWNTNNFKNIEQLRIVAFVQDTLTKEVYQSAYFDPFINTTIHKQIEIEKIYPIPSSDVINLTINQHIYVTNLSIFDVQGKLIQKKNLSNYNGVYKCSINELKPGIYFMNLENKSYKIIKK
jgi:thiol-disulfide isomerase/thioredoxin